MLGFMCDVNGDRCIFIVESSAIAAANILKIEKALADDANEHQVEIKASEIVFPTMSFKVPGRVLRKEGVMYLAATLFKTVKSFINGADDMPSFPVYGELVGVIRFDESERRSLLFKERFHLLSVYQLTVTALVVALLIKVNF